MALLDGTVWALILGLGAAVLFAVEGGKAVLRRMGIQRL